MGWEKQIIWEVPNPIKEMTTSFFKQFQSQKKMEDNYENWEAE